MRVLVCGSRDFNDIKRLYGVLEDFHRTEGPITTLIHNGETGVATLASFWAEEWNIPVLRFPIDNLLDGRKPHDDIMRNIRMYEEGNPDIVIAFLPGDGDTAHIVGFSHFMGTKVVEVRP